MSPNKIRTRFLGSILVAFSIVAGTACSPENSVADVLLDTLAGRENHATWFVTKTIKDSPERNAFYDAFQKDSLFLELRPPDGIGPGTRVKLKTQQVGVEPYLICV